MRGASSAYLIEQNNRASRKGQQRVSHKEAGLVVWVTDFWRGVPKGFRLGFVTKT